MESTVEVDIGRCGDAEVVVGLAADDASYIWPNGRAEFAPYAQWFSRPEGGGYVSLMVATEEEIRTVRPGFVFGGSLPLRQLPDPLRAVAADAWTRRHRVLTYAEFDGEARDRFGDDPLRWAFCCPACGDVATAAEFPPGRVDGIGQECIGRHRDTLAGRLATGRGCDYAAYGLIPGPWEVTKDDGGTVRVFPLADRAEGS